MDPLPPAEHDARAFAIAAHAEQRYGNAPYVVHLERVRAVLRDFEHGGALGVAAWLHDVVEDTTVTRVEVAARFGEDVAELVWAVTGVGATRKERNATAYAKIRAHPPAAILELADRMANVEASRSAPDKLAMYQAEWPSFRENLAPLGDAHMWDRLARAIALP